MNLTEKNSPLTVQSMNMKDGRKFHSDSVSKYWLPMDLEEAQRLNNQHEASKELFGGNIPQIVFDAIIPNLEKGGKFLDLCCGTGIFITEIALDYPNTECIGMDFVDVFQRNDTVKNVSFKLGSVLDPLPFEDNTFDVVSINYGCLVFNAEQWPIAMKDVLRVLKPGGYILSKEPANFHGDSEFVKWAALKYKQRIAKDHIFEIADLLKDILLKAGFDESGSITKSIYLGRPGSVNEKYFINIVQLFKSMLPNLSQHLNLAPDQYDGFLEELAKNFRESDAVYQLGFTYGRKPLSYTDQN